MNTSKLEALLRLAAGTREQELSCTECFDLLPQYVDLELAGRGADVAVPLFRQHLEQCAVCREEYEMVRELARLENENPA